MRLSVLIVLLGLLGTSCSHFSKCGKRHHKGRRCFKTMDANKDGMVSHKEWKTYSKKKCQERSKKKFKMADADGDGKVTHEEWKMMKKGKCSRKSCGKK